MLGPSACRHGCVDLAMEVLKYILKCSFVERGFLDPKQALFWCLWPVEINTYQAFT